MFQIDSSVVKDVYTNATNYHIDYDDSCSEYICAIYFSSNDIYYPNQEDIFRKRIIEKNFFEWYHTRIRAHKHIFLRDVFKQWYLEGINAKLNTPEKVADWLEHETTGYRVVTVGSSAGGYAAVLYGSLLNAERVIAFNAQFSLTSLAEKSSITCNPLVFKYRDTERNKYYQLNTFLCPTIRYYYFLSIGSAWDMEQCYALFGTHPMPPKSLHCIKFKTTRHGVPVLKVALEKVLNLSVSSLDTLVGHKHHPVIFAMQQAGIFKTSYWLLKRIVDSYLRKR